MPPLRLGIIGSGKGSNCRALLEAAQEKSLHYEPVIVLSEVSHAGILSLAESFNIPSRFVEPGPFKTRLSEDAELEILSQLQAAHVDFVALAGFMRVIKAPLLEAFPGKILNIHPSLLPYFRGLEAWKQALEANVHETGCTVHIVDSGVDTGRILGQSRVPVLANDTIETLHARIQEAEHELYPRMVHQFAHELIKKEEGRRE